MAWVRTKDTHVVKLLPQLARLYRALTELKAHQLVVRAQQQARMLAASENRAEKKDALWRGQTGT